MNTSNISNIKFEDIDYDDYPDFCDTFVVSADYNDVTMTEEELSDLNENYRDFVYDELLSYLF